MTQKNQAVETLRWRDGKLEMIDQRVLPARFEYLDYTSATETAEGIRSMVVRGAPAIGCAAAYGVALDALRLRNVSPADFAANMDKAFDVLAASRPTAVNLFWALKRMRAVWETVKDQPVGAIAGRLLAEAHEVAAEDIRINRAMGAFGAELLPDGARVLTHCNAGVLATAGHGTALGVFRSAVEAGKKISVIADETRPFLQGARLTAWEMVQEQIPVTLITDNHGPHAGRQRRFSPCHASFLTLGAHGIAQRLDSAGIPCRVRARTDLGHALRTPQLLELQCLVLH